MKRLQDGSEKLVAVTLSQFCGLAFEDAFLFQEKYTAAGLVVPFLMGTSVAESDHLIEMAARHAERNAARLRGDRAGIAHCIVGIDDEAEVEASWRLRGLAAYRAATGLTAADMRA
jgi:hypothetical protein